MLYKYRRKHRVKRFQLVLHLQGFERTQKLAYVYRENAVASANKKMLRGGDWFEVYDIRTGERIIEGIKPIAKKSDHYVKLVTNIKQDTYQDIAAGNPWVLPDNYQFEITKNGRKR